MNARREELSVAKMEANVESRKAAETLISMALDEGKALEAKYGVAATIRFFDILKSSFIDLRGGGKRVRASNDANRIRKEKRKARRRGGAGADHPRTQRSAARRPDAVLPFRTDLVCANVAGHCVAETAMAYGVAIENREGLVWLPKSQVGDKVMERDESVGQVWMPLWLANQSGFEVIA